MKSDNLKISIFILLLVAFISFVPRMGLLDRQVRPDEMLWVLRSKNFVKALITLDPVNSVSTSHPGITTMWLASFGMAAKDLMRPEDNWHSYLFAARLPIAAAIYFGTLAIFILLKKLYDLQTAAFAFTLIAMDPFLIGYSRIVHLDAVLSMLMCMALLTFIIYQKDGHRRYLHISGVLGGFAILAKLPALILVPFIAILSIFFARNELFEGRSINAVIKDYIIWTVIVFITIFVFNPRMWADPFVFLTMLGSGPGVVEHEYGSFFMGKSVLDPGVMFYPIVLLYRVPVITMVGCLVFVVLLVNHYFGKNIYSIEDKTGSLLLVFVILFVIFMGIFGKKMERYILPVFPIVSIIAGIGISKFIKKIHSSSKRLISERNTFYLIFFCIVIISIFQLARIHPYPTTYFNPFVNGLKSAEKVIGIGWGEGMEESAAYLNKKENAKNLVVGSDFHYLLARYFGGECVPLKIDAYESGDYLNMDYLVITLDAKQKGSQRLHEEVIEYYSKHLPEYRIKLNGINYASIYKVR